MSEFSKLYLDLLRRQVDEEIQFLVRNGHDNARIYVPCMFCIEHKTGYYTCSRLNELRRFLASIIVNGSSKLRVEHERKRIGYETIDNALNLDVKNLPLLSIDL